MKFLNNTPWWLISAGLHAVFLMGAALVYVERLMALDVTPIIIDATADVPWSDVIHVVDLCKTDKLTSIEFAEPMQYRAANR